MLLSLADSILKWGASTLTLQANNTYTATTVVSRALSTSACNTSASP